MDRLTIAGITGIFLCCIGLSVMTGWMLHDNILIVLTPPAISSLYMGFNLALAFFVGGLALIISEFYPRWQVQAQRISGVILVLLAGLTLSERLTGYSLGIDQFFVKVWLPSTSDYPGRMAVNTSLGLISAGLTLLLLSYTEKKSIAVTVQFLTIIVLTLGLSALIGYALDLRVLYGWYTNSQMALTTSISMTIFGLGLWSLWSHHPNYLLLFHDKKDKKILLLSGVSVACVALLTGLIAFAIISNQGSVPYDVVGEKVFLLVLVTIVFGMLLLYWQVVPLVRAVTYSEKDLIAANQMLQESENRFRSAFDFAAVGMALISLDGKCLKINKSLCHMAGYASSELLNTDLRRLIHPEDVKNELHSVQQMVEGNLRNYQAEQRFYHKNGKIIWVMASVSLIYDAEERPLYFISQFQNITAEKRAEEQLKQMAYHDPLTGLANRNKLEQQLHQIIVSAQSDDPGFALIFLDIDHFKNINDTVGHDAGDLLLQVVAERLRSVVRDTDIVARLGGDEFVIVITHVKKVEAVAYIAQKILNTMLKPLFIKGHELYATTSIGVSFYPQDGEDIQTLMKNADLALYLAKDKGRNNYQFCTSEMTTRSKEKIERQHALSNALARDEFVLFYQPKMDLKTNRICGVEALLRWKNDAYGEVTTEEIITLSEESGLIISLSEWVLRTACKQVKEWHLAGFDSLVASVNLSSRQFKQSGFVKNIVQVLEDIEFPANCLELEITESLIMQDPENTLQTLQDFKKIGIKIAIDDFGTGYSSMSYLKRFSVDKIKIDKTFMHQIPKDVTSLSIVTAMIAMAHKLGIKTNAEGIENTEQYEFLLRENCTELQGYILSPPISSEEMVKFLMACASGVKLPTTSKWEYSPEE